MTATISEVLSRIVGQFGTPCFAYDRRCVLRQQARLQESLPSSIRCYYSLKANASLGLCEILAEGPLGADVAGAGELFTAVEAGFDEERIFVAGPCKSHETVSWLAEHPRAIVSVDSPSELERLGQAGLVNRAVLRLRPDFESRACVNAGRGSRFGFVQSELAPARAAVHASSLKVIGFHLFAGSQIMQQDDIRFHCESALEQMRNAAELLDLSLQFVNLGGGFGTPYHAAHVDLDLKAVGQDLKMLQERVPDTEIALELGRYLVAQAGWYLTTVMDVQTHQQRPAAVVDGGTHQRPDFCGLDLRTHGVPPRVLNSVTEERVNTDVLGCLSLPADVLSEAAPLPPLRRGDVLAYPNAGAYGQWSGAVNFHGYGPPPEVLFDGETVELMRAPVSGRHILNGQLSLRSRVNARS